MFKINGETFWSVPCMCGGCPFFLSFGKMDANRDSSSGLCTQFDKRKSYYANIPKRCQDLFDKAQTFPDGTELVIVAKQ